MTRTQRIRLTCPSCGAEVDHTAVMSTTTYGQDTDFRPLSAGIPPRAVTMSSCHRCGFTGSEDDFPGSLSPTVAAQIAGMERPDDAAGRWAAAALIAHWRGRPDEDVGFRYLNAAWCVLDDGGDLPRERGYRRKAIEHFERHLRSDVVAGRAELTYLVGELYRRVGETSPAHEWFDRAVALAGGDPSLGWLAQLARQQKTAPQDRRQ